MIWLLVGYLFFEIHRPYEIWPWLAGYSVERWYMVSVIIYWLLTRLSLPRADRLHWRFALFVLVMLASWVSTPCGKVGNDCVENYLKYAIFYFLLVANVRTDRDLRQIIVGYLAVMALWMLHSLREYFLFGNRIWAQGLVRLAPVGSSYDFNDFAGLMVSSLPFAWAYWRQATGRMQRTLAYGYCGLVAFCVVMTGSRMGFVGLILAGLLGCAASAWRWRLLIAYPFVLAALWLALPEGNRDRYTTLFNPDYQSVFGAAAIGDYRYGAIERGLSMFKDRPLLGYGPISFMVVGFHGMMAHNLYAQLLGELGILGALAFAAIVVGVGQNFREGRRICQSYDDLKGTLAWQCVAASAATFILLLVMSWGFNFLYWYVWLLFGGLQVVALRNLKDNAASIGLDEEDEEYLPEDDIEEIGA